jgi:ribose transport system permease protein
MLRAVPAIRGNAFPILILLVVTVTTAVFVPDFFQVQNMINVSRQASIIGVVAVGMTFVILAGGIDLSVGSILALGAVCSSTFYEAGLPPALVLVLVVLVGAAVGLLNGIGVVVLKIQPFVMTLAMMVVARGFTMRLTDGTVEPFPAGDSELLNFFGRARIFGEIPGPFVVFLVVALIAGLALKAIPFGRKIYAVGGSQEAARLSGVRTGRVVAATYVISGACSGLAGLMTASRLTVGDPLAGTLVELDAIAAVVIGGASLIGGVGTMVGTVAGVFLLAILSNVLNLLGVGPFDQQMVKGGMIVLAVLLSSAALREVLTSVRRRPTAAGPSASPTADEPPDLEPAGATAPSESR